MFISIHQDGLYPSAPSGQLEELGEGPGDGYNINVPLPPGTGTGGYRAAFERVVLPALDWFKADVLLVSCGFDASALDPLGRMMLSSSFFGWMTQQLVQRYPTKLIVVHEGGYSPEAVPFCGVRVIEQLLQYKTNVVDPYDHEINAYPYHELQPHQERVINAAQMNLQRTQAKQKQ
eukprot:TRINITY_DN14974_c0_g1_i1.p1 TRINITY_DN14974_c0_g1~~TRINITY_DN14974_c0_g1_i1.p1  ORF type:complete len:176 (-),score=45.78 TRINITY_DN14974_c0_g1_i1:19-546(-)